METLLTTPSRIPISDGSRKLYTALSLLVSQSLYVAFYLAVGGVLWTIFWNLIERIMAVKASQGYRLFELPQGGIHQILERGAPLAYQSYNGRWQAICSAKANPPAAKTSPISAEELSKHTKSLVPTLLRYPMGIRPTTGYVAVNAYL
jgi:hypothetical protein